MNLRPTPETRSVTLVFIGGPMDGRTDPPVESPLGRYKARGGVYQLIGFQRPQDYLGDEFKPSPFAYDRAVYRWEPTQCSAT
jgi:hypothetical protein